MYVYSYMFYVNVKDIHYYFNNLTFVVSIFKEDKVVDCFYPYGGMITL